MTQQMTITFSEQEVMYLLLGINNSIRDCQKELQTIEEKTDNASVENKQIFTRMMQSFRDLEQRFMTTEWSET